MSQNIELTRQWQGVDGTVYSNISNNYIEFFVSDTAPTDTVTGHLLAPKFGVIRSELPDGTVYFRAHSLKAILAVSS